MEYDEDEEAINVIFGDTSGAVSETEVLKLYVDSEDGGLNIAYEEESEE